MGQPVEVQILSSARSKRESPTPRSGKAIGAGGLEGGANPLERSLVGAVVPTARSNHPSPVVLPPHRPMKIIGPTEPSNYQLSFTLTFTFNNAARRLIVKLHPRLVVRLLPRLILRLLS